MKTNNLDLNAYAVEELNEVETLEMEGGSVPWYAGALLAFALNQAVNIYNDWDNISDKIAEGYNDGKN